MTTRLYAVKRGVWNAPSGPIYEGLLISSAGEVMGLGKGPTIEALKDDLCVSDKRQDKHEKLRNRFKGGYRVVWCETSRHKGLQAALRILRRHSPKDLELEAEGFVADGTLAQS